MTETIVCDDGEKIVLTKKKLDKIDAICKEVLKEIKPDNKAFDNANEFCKKLQKIMGKEAKVVLAGSVAKGTNLR